MANAVEREIKFLISVGNQFSKGLGDFSGEIGKIKKEIDSLNELASADTGFKEAKKNITSFMKSVASIYKGGSGGKQPQYLKQFNEITKSFGRITKGAELSSKSLNNITLIFKKVAEAGSLIGNKSKEVSAAMGSFKMLAENIHKLADVNLDNLRVVSTLFHNLSGALGKVASGQVTESIKVIGENYQPLQRVALALKSIVRSLSNPQVLAGANAIARIGNLGGIGGGGGGGTIYGPVNVGKLGTRTFEDLVKGFQEAATYGSGREPGLNIGYNAAAEKFMTSIKEGAIHPSALGSLFSGKIHAETMPKEIGTISSARGQLIHSFQEQLLKEIEAKEGVNNFIKRQGYKDIQWIKKITQDAKLARTEFERLAKEAAAKSNLQLDEGLLNQIRNAGKEVFKEIVQYGAKRRGLFPQLLKQIRENVGGDAVRLKQALDAMTVQVEKELGPMTVIEPGFKAVKGVPKEALLLVGRSLKQLKANLSPEKYNEILKLIKDYGLRIQGTADIVASFGKVMDSMIIDLKTGTKTTGAGRYARAQQTAYQTMLGRPSQAFIYAPGRGGALEPTGIQAGGVPESISQEETIKKIEKERLELGHKATQEIIRFWEMQAKVSATSQEILAKTKEEVAARGQVVAEVKQEAAIRSEMASTPPGGGTQPPGGGTSGGGGIIPPISTKLSDMANLMIKESIAAQSKYIQALTKAYLKQKMFGESVDLTKVKLSEYANLVNGLAGTFSKYVTIHKTGIDEQNTFVSTLERLKKEMDLYSSGMERANEMNVKFNAGFDALIKKMRQGGWGDVVKDIYKKVGESATPNESFLNLLSDRNLFKKEAGGAEIEKQVSNLVNMKRDIATLTKQYGEFNTKLIKALQSGKSEDEMLNKLAGTIHKLGPGFREAAGSIQTMSDAVELLNSSMAEQHRRELVMMIDTEKVESKLAKYDARFKSTGASVDKYSQSMASLSLGLKVLGERNSYLTSQMAMVEKAMFLTEDKLLRLEATLGAEAKETKKVREESLKLKQTFNTLGKQIEKTRTEFNQMSEIQRQHAGKTAESFRGMVRTTLKGFGDMMKSQAAWVMGYGVMFGAITGLKNALGSVIEVEHQFARAMRTARSEMMSSINIIKEFRTAGVMAMVKFGKSAADVGEVLYQLGSAGLQAEEATAALNSTMALLVGTEGDVTESTKMIAGIYNNFKDNIRGAITLQEKFAYINNIVVRTFREHQVELNELREGYKHLIAMGKVANLSFVEMSGILGTLNDHMIKSGIAGRSIQTVLSRISRDPYQFARAFNVAIDPKKPLHFIKIIKEIGEQFKKQGMTVEDVGRIFQRLGLRGAKAFAVLIKNSDELIENINDLKTNSNGAFEEMAKVMMEKPDVAFAKMRESLAVLVREGFGPIVKFGQMFAVTVSGIGFSIGKLDESIRGVLSTLIRLFTVFSAVKGLTAIISLLGKRFAGATSDGETLMLVFSKFGIYLRKIVMSTKTIFAVLAGREVWDIATKGVFTLTSAFKKLGVAITGSTLALYSLLGMLGVYAIYKLIDSLVVTNNEYREMISNLEQVSRKSENEITAIKSKIAEYKTLNGEISKANNLIGQNLLQQLEASIQKGIDVQTEAAKKAISAAKGLAESTTALIDQYDQAVIQQNQARAPITGMETYPAFILKTPTQLREEMRKLHEENEKTLKSIKESIEFWDKFSEFLKGKYPKAYKVIIGYISGLKKGQEELASANEKLFERLRNQSEGVREAADKASRAIKSFSGEWDKYINKQIEATKEGPLSKAIINLDEARKALTIVAETQVTEMKKPKIGASREEIERWKELVDKQKASILNTYAAEKAGNKLARTTEHQRKVVGDLLKAILNKNKAEQQNARTVRSLISQYDQLEVSLGNMANAALKFKSLTFFGGLISQIIQSRNQINNIDKRIESFFTKYKNLKDESARTDFLNAKGFSSIDEARKKFNEFRKQIKDLNDLNLKILEQQALYKYTQSLIKAERNHSNAIADLIDKSKEYLTVQDKDAAYTRQLKAEEDKLLDSIHDLNQKMKEKKEIRNKLNDPQIIAFYNKELEADREKKEYLEDQLKKHKEIEPILKKIFHWNAKIADEISKAQTKGTLFDKLASSQLFTGDFGAAQSTMEAALKARNYAETKQTEKIIHDAINSKIITQQKGDEMLEALESAHLEKMKYLHLDYIEARKQSDQDLYDREAELAMRNSKNMNDLYEAMIKTIKAGSFKFFTENENIAAHVADMTNQSINMFTTSMSDMLNMWAQGTAESSQDYIETMKKMLTDVGKMLTEYGMKLMMVIMLQKLAGFFTANIGTTNVSPITNGLGSTGGAALSFNQAAATSSLAMPSFQASGGYLKGGISNKDSIPILGMPGEYMIPKDSVDYYGRDLFDRLRKKEIKRMQSGGLISSEPINTIPSSKDNIREGDNITYINIKTNDVNSFRQALYENKDLVSNMVLEDFSDRGIIKG